MRRSFVSVGDISANSLSRSAGVARMSAMSVLQKTTDPAPIIAILCRLITVSRDASSPDLYRWRQPRLDTFPET